MPATWVAWFDRFEYVDGRSAAAEVVVRRAGSSAVVDERRHAFTGQIDREADERVHLGEWRFCTFIVEN